MNEKTPQAHFGSQWLQRQSKKGPSNGWLFRHYFLGMLDIHFLHLCYDLACCAALYDYLLSDAAAQDPRRSSNGQGKWMGCMHGIYGTVCVVWGMLRILQGESLARIAECSNGLMLP